MGEKAPPPPYSESAPAAAAAPSPAPQHVPSSAAAGPSINRQFPPAFNLYSAGGGFGRQYTLGEHQDQPLYAVETHSGWSGQPAVVMHSGPDADSSPPLATVDFVRFSSDMTITLPALPGRDDPQRGAEESVDGRGFASHTYAFEIEVGEGGRAARERFEWRHSRGDEIAALGGRSSGYKLVRLDGAPGPAARATTSDGREVLAVCGWSSMSLSKRFLFAFVGTGLEGGLGERWAVMTVVTALGIFEKVRRQRSRNSAGAAGGAASS